MYKCIITSIIGTKYLLYQFNSFSHLKLVTLFNLSVLRSSMAKWQQVMKGVLELDSCGSATEQLCDLGQVTFFSGLVFLACKMRVACSQPNIY